jgi:hypothetical protein
MINEVGIANEYGLDDRGGEVRIPVGSRIFTSLYRPDRPLGPTQPIRSVLGPLSPGVKWQGREADDSPSTSAKVKKMWIYTSTPPYVFMAWRLIG